MSWWDRNRGGEDSREPGRIRRALRSVYEDRPPPSDSDRVEHHFRMDLRTGEIVPLDAHGRAPRADEEARWRPLGEIGRATGRTVDLEKARRWRPLSDRWRWR